MHIALRNYIDTFKVYFKALDEVTAMRRSLNAAEQAEIGVAYDAIFNTEEAGPDKDTARQLFFDYLKSDNADANALVETGEGKQLGVFECLAADHEFASLPRQYLQAQLALWHAHRCLLTWMSENPHAEGEFYECDEMREILWTNRGFALHEQLSSCDIWETVVQQIQPDDSKLDLVAIPDFKLPGCCPDGCSH